MICCLEGVRRTDILEILQDQDIHLNIMEFIKQIDGNNTTKIIISEETAGLLMMKSGIIQTDSHNVKKERRLEPYKITIMCYEMTQFLSGTTRTIYKDSFMYI